MHKYLRAIQRFYFAFTAIPVGAIMSGWMKKDCENIVWFWPSYPRRKKENIRDSWHEIFLMKALADKKIPFKVHIGPNIGKFKGKKIFYCLNKYYNLFGFQHYSDVLGHITDQLENQDNILIPSKHEASHWENKLFMHREFDRLGINTPKTDILSIKEILYADHDYPFLIKDPNSAGSAGLYKIKDKKDIEDLHKDVFKNPSKLLLKQRLINMRSDLRVILIGDEIVHAYWRKNPSDEWKPTSTSFGSRVVFGEFPEQWRSHIIETFKKLEIATGGFDVTWENDDLSNEPLYLEVSSQYSPNPKFKSDYKNERYGKYKKMFQIKDSYQKNFKDLFVDLYKEFIDYKLKELDAKK